MQKKILFLLLLFQSAIAFAQLEFIENQGQWPVPYQFRAKLNHGDLWIKGNEAAFVLSDFGSSSGHHHAGHSGDPANAKDHCYRMEFTGAQVGVRTEGREKKGHYHNYFTGSNPNRWKSGVALYGSMVQKDIYPGTDLIWKEDNGQLKYEFHLQAGADPQAIRTRYNGADATSLQNGKLEIKTSLGTVIENHPIAFQMSPNGKKNVPCRFKQLGTNSFGFDFPIGYDPKLPLVIDPVLIFSSFSGSRSDNWGFSATYGENGTAYAGGIALGPRFPVTTGAFQSGFQGDTTNFFALYTTFDISILKFSSQGNQLLFATYLGGAEAEVPSSMVVDKDLHLVVLGASSSSNFPTTLGAYDQTYNGGVNVPPFGPSQSSVRFRQGSDIVISRFSPDGTQLTGSTFLGGTANDGLLTLLSPGNSPLVKNYGDSFRGEVVTDSLGRIYIASNTSSPDFPVVQPVQASKAAGSDAICARFNSNLTNLEFSTFLGGNQDDAAYSIQINSQNQIYLSGGTASPNFPSTAGTVRPVFSGQVDGFVCRIIPGASSGALRSTFLGTNSYDQCYFVQFDKNEKVYLFGQTTGNWPVSPGVYANPNSAQFITCLSKNLDSTRFSTCFGTGSLNPNISPTAFLVDDCGRIYCSGWGGFTNNSGDYSNGLTTGMPTTSDALIRNSDGSDFYMMVLEKNAVALNFATFFGDTLSGSEHVDGGTSRFDKKGVVYQSVCAGCGGSSTFPTTPGVVSNVNPSGRCNNALFKYDFSAVKARFEPSAIQGCAPLSLTFNNLSLNGEIYRWNFQDGTAYDTTAEEVSHTFSEGGQFNVKLIAINNTACPFIDSLTVPITVQKAPGFPGDSLAFCQPGQNISLPALPAGPYSYQWFPATFLSNPAVPAPVVNGPTQSIVYQATISTSLGCQSTGKFKVSNGILRAKAEADTLKGCVPLTVNFQNKSFQSKQSVWHWGTGDSSVSNAGQLAFTFTQAGVYNVVLKARNDTTCEKERTDTLTVQAFSLPEFGDTLQYFCQAGPINLVAAANRGKSWSWSPGNLLADSAAASPLFLNPVNMDFRLSIRDSNACRAENVVRVRNGILRALAGTDTLRLCRPAVFQFQNFSIRSKKSTWFWGNGDSTITNLSSVPHPFPNAGNYRVVLKVENDSSCLKTDRDTLNIQVFDLPLFSDTSYRICQDGPLVLSAAANKGQTFLWSPGQALSDSTQRNPVFGNPVPGRFVLKISDQNGCRASAGVQLKEGRLKAGFTLSSADNCVPEALIINNNSFNSQAAVWYFENDSIQTGGGTIPNFTAQNPGIQTITLKVKNDTTCRTEDVATRTLVLGGVLSIPNTLLNFCPGDSLVLTAVNRPGYSYSWPAPAIAQPQGYLASLPTGTDSLTLNVTMQDSLNCTGSQIFELRPVKPEAEFTTRSLLDSCNDVLNYRFVAQSLPGTSYSWRLEPSLVFAGDTVDYTFPQRGEYTLQLIVNQSNCKDTLVQKIRIQDKKTELISAFAYTKNLLDCNLPPELILKNNSVGANAYRWSWDGNFSEEKEPRIVPDKTKTLNIRLDAIRGACVKSYSEDIEVEALSAPNLITLNGDGKNDNFRIENLPLKTSLQIRNRWGELLYSNPDYQGDWYPEGGDDTVFYVLKLANGTRCHGWIYISR